MSPDPMSSQEDKSPIEAAGPGRQDEEQQQKIRRGAVILVNTFALPSLQRLQTFTQVTPRALHMVFNCSWAEPLAIPDDLSGYARVTQDGAPANVLTLAMDTSVPLSSSIEVRSLGEYLEPVQFVYELADGTSQIARPSGNLCMDFDDFTFTASAERFAPSNFGPKAYLEQLRRLIDTDDSPVGKARKFFSELDRRAEARLRDVAGIDESERIGTRNHMTGLMYALSGRFAERHGKTAHADYTKRANVKADVEHVSKMMLELATKYFADASGRISLDRFSEAFEMFANGELRLQLPSFGVWSNQPSSGYYFYFAELAFLAIECDIQAEEWGRLLKVLVRTQEIYCTAYSPGKGLDPADRKLWDYKACNFHERKQLDASAKAALRTTYAAITGSEALSVRSAKNAKDFVGGY
jgi:hypothetical protein